MNWFILAFISALFSAASAVSEKKALFSLDAIDFSFVVSLLTLILSIPFFLAVNIQDISTLSLLLLFLKTFLGAGAFLCVMLSMKNLDISEALPLLALSPGLVAVAGVIFINDSLNATEWFGITLMVIGAYILELRKNNKNALAPLKALFDFSKYAYVFTALLLFTITSLLDRVLLKGFKLPPYTFMAFQQLFYALFFLIAYLIKNKTVTIQFKGWGRNIFYLIGLISVFTVIYRLTQIEATKIAPVALVLSVKRLSVLFAVIYGGKLFSEENLYRRIAAVIIIIAGATLLLNS